MCIWNICYITAVDAFIVKGGENRGTGWIVGDTTNKNGLVAITGKSGGSIRSASACTKFNFVDVDFGSKFDLVEKTTFVSAKIVMVNEIHVL